MISSFLNELIISYKPQLLQLNYSRSLFPVIAWYGIIYLMIHHIDLGCCVLVKHFCNTYGLFFQLDCYSSLPEVLPKIKGGPLLCNKPLTWVRIS